MSWFFLVLADGLALLPIKYCVPVLEKLRQTLRQQIKCVDYWVEWLKFSKHLSASLYIANRTNTAPKAFHSPHPQMCFAWKQNTKGTQKKQQISQKILAASFLWNSSFWPLHLGPISLWFPATHAAPYSEQGHTRQKGLGNAFLIKIKWARGRMANIPKILRTWARQRGKDPAGSRRNTTGSQSATRENTREHWSLEKPSPTDGSGLWH